MDVVGTEVFGDGTEVRDGGEGEMEVDEMGVVLGE